MKKAIYCFTLAGFFFCISESCSIDDPIAPKADFTFKVDTHGKVIYKNTSKNASKFHWDFGNDVTSTAFDTTIQYIKNTTYMVSLTATSANGKSHTKQRKVLVETVRIPTRMSFEGTFSLGKLSFIDGEEGVKFENQFWFCCAYKTSIYKDYSVPIDFVITHDPKREGPKTFERFIETIFIKGYNEIGQYILGPDRRPGMYLKYYIGGRLSHYNSPQKIEVIEVLKKDNKTCSCDTESFWIKYKVEVEDLKGILIIRYDNTCCLTER
ncbi:PKD domain-containing protein [Emticicia agri]|uniref:PKD domain-containing protein n=1 Tax=Emticicia agri TaxID=2492393 RepID=A0A4Q5LXL9_9BACT|nr:PKD domain-containing protein [Emticicia agri]RYU94571.1 hypothetical protein EWM59_16560 [Emticicia agri]